MRGLSSVLLFGMSLCWAQAPSIVGAGFSNPYPVAVAPGQLLTLFVAPGSGYDTSLPLPSIDAVFWDGSASEAMPIVQVNPTNGACNVPPNSGCTNLLAVTVQVPFDARIVPVAGSNIVVVPSSVAVSVAGAQTSYAGVQPFSDHVHILTSCDLIAGGSSAFQGYQGVHCASVVTHSDGKLVSAIEPATAGEELVAYATYATGLGQTNPSLTTGQPAAQSSPTVATFHLDFNYRPNALATWPLSASAVPLFSGATKGFIGLYQINFIVPPAPERLAACSSAGVTPDVANEIFSNLTVSVGSIFSFDGAGICVVPSVG
jgi:uncharacterized protein (TIGR03437 family)